MKTIKNPQNSAPAETADTGRIAVGASFKLLPPADVQDASRIRTGASFALLPAAAR